MNGPGVEGDQPQSLWRMVAYSKWGKEAARSRSTRAWDAMAKQFGLFKNVKHYKKTRGGSGLGVHFFQVCGQT